MTPITLAIIGGSGIYNMPDLENPKEYDVDTPFGKPSAPIVSGMLEGKRVAFLARHGRGHIFSPGEVNYRANIYALKALGAERVVSISAFGSMREDYVPGEIVIPDGVFDLTHARKRTFFEGNCVVHISVPDPFCGILSRQLYQAVEATGATVHNGGACLTVEGPRFSTKTESHFYRSLGMAIIGMTTSPEVFLAREAEMCYAVMAHVTDYDVWHVSEQPVSVEQVTRILGRNTQVAQQAVRNLVGLLKKERSCECENTLANALITQREKIPAETRERLGLFLDKYLK